MYLKKPKASTDQRVRSLLQKAVRRGDTGIVDLALTRLDSVGDKTWLRSRTIVITYEECWPLAALLSVDRNLSSKRKALFDVAKSAKEKDAAGLGALAHAYREGDHSMLDCVPDSYSLRIVSEALERPDAFFEWITTQVKTSQAGKVIQSSERYLAAATWPWDKACILAGGWLAINRQIPSIETTAGPNPDENFPYWIALDKHTPEGKIALTEVAKKLNSSYRCLIWASFYFESAKVDRLLPSPWWDAERTWRLRKAGLSLHEAEALWSRARPLVRDRLKDEAAALKHLVESNPALASVPSLWPT
jgi:hypothetical protein